MQLHSTVNHLTFPNSLGDAPHADFSGVSFVEPLALVGTIAMLEGQRAAGQQVTFTAPANSNVENYLSRMHYGAALDELGIAHSLRPVRERALGSELLELQKISGEYAGEQVANLVEGKLRDSGADAQIRESLHSAICETVNNVAYHAEVDHGYVAAQSMAGRVLFAIADAGIGLKGSIAKKMVVDDDRNAIELATVANVTSTGEQGRGQGLTDVVETAIGLGGFVVIASGDAIFSYRGDTVTKRGASAPFNGTLIQVSLPV